MLTTNDRQWYIDPIQSPDLLSDRVLVQKERWARSTSTMNTIVKVKRYEVEGVRVWWMTEEGNYVQGAPVGPANIASYRLVVGLNDDGTWLVGDTYVRSEEKKTTSVRNVLRSDFMVMDAPGGGVYSAVNSRDFVKAAPWARTLMPEAVDSDAVVRAKVALAKKKWERRWAEAEIMREALERGWDTDLDELHENGTMSKPVYGVVVDGTAMVPLLGAMPTISTEDRERINALATRSGAAAPSFRSAMVPVPIRYAMDLQSTDPDDVNAPNMSLLRSTVRDTLGEPRALLGDYDASRIITSLSTAS